MLHKLGRMAPRELSAPLPRREVKRVLLVGTNIGEMNDHRMVMPTALDYLASELVRHQIEVKCLDLGLVGTPFVVPSEDENSGSRRHLYNERRWHLVREIENGGYDMVALSFRNIDLSIGMPDDCNAGTIEPHFLGQIQGLADHINELSNRPILTMGGPAFSLFSQALFDRFHLDYGVTGQGEAALPWIIERLNAGNPLPRGVYGKRFDFASAVYSRGHINLKRYFDMAVAASVQTKRGCDAVCQYCNYPAIEGRSYRLRPASVVVDEIEWLNKQHVFSQEFYFTDAVFNWPSSHAKAIMREIIRRGLDIRFFAMTNPRGIDEEFIDLALSSGLFRGVTAQEQMILSLDLMRNALFMIEEVDAEGCPVDLYSDGSRGIGNDFRIPASIYRMLNVGTQRKNLFLGVDSADDSELTSLGKGFLRADIKRVIDICKGHGIGVTLEFLFGGPNTTEASIRNSMQFAIDSGAAAVSVGVKMRVYPRTKLAELSRGSLWKREEDLLETVFYPSQMDERAMLDVASSYCMKIPMVYNFEGRGIF